MHYYKPTQTLSNFVLADLKKSLEQMSASFKLDAKSVINCTKHVEKTLSELKEKSLDEKLNQFDDLDSTIKLIEKLSIVNEYKLNLFNDFSSSINQKK